MSAAPEHECLRDLGSTQCAFCRRELGWSYPTFLTHPSKRVAREIAVAHAEEAMLTILLAVSAGATFVLTGPDLLHNSRTRYGAALESGTGSRYVDAHGETLAGVLAQIATQWRRDLERDGVR